MHFIRNKPKVSIVIVCYNSEKYIKIAIESVRGQKYKNWELIIVNDCSRDATQKIIERYKSKKIKIISLKRNVGAYKATNLAFKKARGEYIAILDSDDYSHPKRILSQVLELENDYNIGLVFTKYKIVNEHNKLKKNKEFKLKKDFDSRFPCENLICNSSAMFRRKFIKQLGFYNKSYFYSYDYYFYLKIFMVSKIKLINKFYTYYRIHENQRTIKMKEKIIIQENIRHLIWSLNNGLINVSNIFLFSKKFIIFLVKLLFVVLKSK
jgi:glycosyltransferase involved in cell wall biosynthesis